MPTTDDPFASIRNDPVFRRKLNNIQSVRGKIEGKTLQNNYGEEAILHLFLFPSNNGHSNTDFFAPHTGGGLAAAAASLRNNTIPSPSHGLPTTAYGIPYISEEHAKSQLVHLWRAVGQGYIPVLPVRDTQDSNTVFSNFDEQLNSFNEQFDGNIQHRIEPSFWGGVNAQPQEKEKNLPKLYLEELAKLQQFITDWNNAHPQKRYDIIARLDNEHFADALLDGLGDPIVTTYDLLQKYAYQKPRPVNTPGRQAPDAPVIPDTMAGAAAAVPSATPAAASGIGLSDAYPANTNAASPPVVNTAQVKVFSNIFHIKAQHSPTPNQTMFAIFDSNHATVGKFSVQKRENQFHYQTKTEDAKDETAYKSTLRAMTRAYIEHNPQVKVIEINSFNNNLTAVMECINTIREYNDSLPADQLDKKKLFKLSGAAANRYRDVFAEMQKPYPGQQSDPKDEYKNFAHAAQYAFAHNEHAAQELAMHFVFPPAPSADPNGSSSPRPRLKPYSQINNREENRGIP